MANGIDTNAWVEKDRSRLLLYVSEYSAEMKRFSDLEDYLDQLEEFLRNSKSDKIQIRHHYEKS